ncbi:MAG TPA: hypothetical protein DHV55_01500 [Clostridiaceae bacterium]|nr:hypothetical protein [Clostridiaceae bacterium]
MYADRVFNEEEVIHKLIELEKPLLVKLGHEVKCSNISKTMYDNVSEANDWKADIYIAQHSNACTGKNDGTLGLYYPSVKSKLLTKCIYEEVAKTTPSSDEGMREGKELYELRKTSMPATLIEMFYHDNIADMKFGLLNLDKIAEAVVRGIDKYCKSIR